MGSLSSLRYYPSIFLEGLRETMKNLIVLAKIRTGNLPVQVKGITIWANLLSPVVSKLGAGGWQTQLYTCFAWPRVTYHCHGKQTLHQIPYLGKKKIKLKNNSADISRHNLHAGVSEGSIEERWLQGNWKEHSACLTVPLDMEEALTEQGRKGAMQCLHEFPHYPVSFYRLKYSKSFERNRNDWLIAN
jgi:hypothetical protein